VAEDVDSLESVRREMVAQRELALANAEALAKLDASLVLLADRVRFLIREIRAVSLEARALRKETAQLVHRETSLRTAIMVTLNTLDRIDPPKTKP
jgi:hypothetical protein